LLGTPAMNYTIIGDPGTYLQGLALAAQWLTEGQVDGCLVVGAEECDWLTSDAFHHFSRQVVLSDGAGAVYLKRDTGTANPIQLRYVTEPCLFTKGQGRAQAVKQVRAKLPPCSPDHLLSDSFQNIPRFDAAETNAWRNWTGGRLSAKTILGEGLMAAAAWQCVLAIDALKQERYAAASVSVVGCNQQAIGAHFVNVAFKA
jgi:3-Oxoacyl-[acyl-carrier-protein (ACP)] synthase III